MELLKYVYFCAQKSITKAGSNMFQDLINVPRTVSQFAGIGKVTALKAFENNSHLLTSLGCGRLTTETIDNVEDCVCKIYDPSTEITQIDQMRVF